MQLFQCKLINRNDVLCEGFAVSPKQDRSVEFYFPTAIDEHGNKYVTGSVVAGENLGVRAGPWFPAGVPETVAFTFTNVASDATRFNTFWIDRAQTARFTGVPIVRGSEPTAVGGAEAGGTAATAPVPPPPASGRVPAARVGMSLATRIGDVEVRLAGCGRDERNDVICKGTATSPKLDRFVELYFPGAIDQYGTKYVTGSTVGGRHLGVRAGPKLLANEPTPVSFTFAKVPSDVTRFNILWIDRSRGARFTGLDIAPAGVSTGVVPQ